ncbi:MAG: transposase [Solirubrobacteraceae bacterium]
MRLVGLAECGTHAITSAALGPYETSENELADELLGALGPGMLCLADRGFYSFERFKMARETGAQLLWRVKSNMRPPREQTLPDGSYLSSVYAFSDRHAHSDPAKVRVIEYQLEDPGLS